MVEAAIAAAVMVDHLTPVAMPLTPVLDMVLPATADTATNMEVQAAVCTAEQADYTAERAVTVVVMEEMATVRLELGTS